MRLDELMGGKAIGGAGNGTGGGIAVPPVAITGITADSRGVEPGFAFFAVPGSRADGLSFVPDALARGAAAVIADRRPAMALGEAVFVEVADVRVSLAQAAARFYPRQPKTIVAVTGTSGKTSVAAFVRQLWEGQGLDAAALGTTGVVTSAGERYGSLTTPDPITLHRLLDELCGEGITHLALEASSHGLDQRRLDGVRLAAGAFTNLSRDHLDYHASPEAYLAAKLRLFEDLLASGQPAVINADSDVAASVIAAAERRGLDVLTVGVNGRSLRLVDLRADASGSEMTILHAGKTYRTRLPLVGAFMASNALVAAGLVLATGGAPDEIFAGIATLEGAPGRLQRVGEHHGAPIFVDYAHKPDALEKVLEALRPLATRRLVVVFGCGGDRDPGKRPMMGEIAARLADITVITDDNPRSEDPALIRAAILGAAPGAREIGDRGHAIAEAIALLSQGDLLVIAGKGHETGQIIGTRTLPFSDSEAVRAALEELAA